MKIQELTQTINQLDTEIADLYNKMKMSKGSSQQMYKQRCLLVLKKKKMFKKFIQA